MSRAIMHAQIEADQHAAEAALERLPVEQQEAILHGEGFTTDWHVTITDSDIDALFEEMFAKPFLGVEDSAGLVDVDFEGELEDYCEWLDDNAFWARGQF